MSPYSHTQLTDRYSLTLIDSYIHPFAHPPGTKTLIYPHNHTAAHLRIGIRGRRYKPE